MLPQDPRTGPSNMLTCHTHHHTNHTRWDVILTTTVWGLRLLSFYICSASFYLVPQTLEPRIEVPGEPMTTTAVLSVLAKVIAVIAGHGSAEMSFRNVFFQLVSWWLWGTSLEVTWQEERAQPWKSISTEKKKLVWKPAKLESRLWD